MQKLSKFHNIEKEMLNLICKMLLKISNNIELEGKRLIPWTIYIYLIIPMHMVLSFLA